MTDGKPVSWQAAQWLGQPYRTQGEYLHLGFPSPGGLSSKERASRRAGPRCIFLRATLNTLNTSQLHPDLNHLRTPSAFAEKPRLDWISKVSRLESSSRRGISFSLCNLLFAVVYSPAHCRELIPRIYVWFRLFHSSKALTPRPTAYEFIPTSSFPRLLSFGCFHDYGLLAKNSHIC